MILAGGHGSRLGVLTRTLAKPAVHFGGKYRLIDFTLSNCYNSGFDTVGVLIQYQPFELHSYIGIGGPWDLDRKDGGVFVLPPFLQSRGGEWYKGTANAIYQNIHFIDQFCPEQVLILSGDHIYTMDYSLMLDFHRQRQAEVTIAVTEVPLEEASRFGIMNTGDDSRIVEFEEKPVKPKSNLASMGVYVFNWPLLKKYLAEDDNNAGSKHDFGKNIIPAMLNGSRKVMAYHFEGYWRDVGTVESLWEANMDLLGDNPKLELYNQKWRIYSVNPSLPPHRVIDGGRVKRSLVCVGCLIEGEVENSVLSHGVKVGPGTIVKDSVVMSGAKIGAGAYIEKAIIGLQAIIEDGCLIGGGKQDSDEKITVVGEHTHVPAKTVIPSGTMMN
jgi:glucose-1-phosphate adenylyltransferase